MNQILKTSRIGIIGGGISGLALAILLRQKGYHNLRVFEKDESFQRRRQGYGLTILQGKRVLKQLGVLEQAKKWNSPTKAHYFFNQSGKLLGFYGTLFWDSEKGSRSSRWKQKGLSMHIPRQLLRKILLERLQTLYSSDQIVVWKSKLQKIVCGNDGIRLEMSNRIEEVDLVVGADGIFSNVRQLGTVNDPKLNFLGVMIVLGISGCRHSLTTERIFQSSNGEGRFYSMPFLKNEEQKKSMWQFSIPMPKDKIKEYQTSPEKIKDFMENYCRNWHQPIPELIGNTPVQSFMTLSAFDRDPSPPEMIDPRIILIGDACHPMSPFKSQGANQALLDAHMLSSLIDNGSDIAKVSKQFEREQFQRTSKKVLTSRQRVLKYHTSSYLTPQSYIYPKIDAELIKLINAEQIDFNTGDQVEQKIISIMRKGNYL